MSGPIRVLVVDDYALVREGLIRLLEHSASAVPVGQAASGSAAIEMAQDVQPDVALVDLRMPQMDGIETTRSLIEACPAIKVLILSDVESEEALMRAFRAGAYAYVLKTQPFEAVLRAIDTANDGSLTLPRDLTLRAIGRERTIRSNAKRLSASSDLTDRERQILRWITTGESNRQIAERLVISEHTVRAHLRNLMIKLGVANRAQAAAVAASYLGAESDEQQGVTLR